jgi:hypothetical protein
MLDDPSMSQMLLPQVRMSAALARRASRFAVVGFDLLIGWAGVRGRRAQLPEGMRDPVMIKSLLKQPEYRKMLEQSFEQMNTGQMDPQMLQAMQQGMNGNPEWQNQFDQVRWRAPLSVEWTILVPPPTFAG